ncbi:MAG: hypothetical protein JW850_15035 [Thermoflexales bacterium]|nr:hypothetical protein [Thermoflexales bacterium]
MGRWYVGAWVILLCLLPACVGDAATQRARNCVYIRDTLGAIVLGYQERHGRLPDTFAEAHEESGVVLPNRGDVAGRTLIYVKTGEDSFYFLSYGPNGKNDAGLGDDLKVEYQAGWLTACSF